MNLTERSLSKVPEITALFWVTKLLTTAMGESTSDYLVIKMNPVLAVGLGAVVLLRALVLQFRADRYIPGHHQIPFRAERIESVGRAMIEVQAYFRWLRWNLVCALEGNPLPPEVNMPNIKRAEGRPMWSAPSEVPRWT
jgi:hypothetical protein